MAYYNTTIWIVMMLVTVRLSSTMHGDDQEDSLEQNLLDGYESSNAEPADNEIELSKLELLAEYDYLQTLNRGIFTSAQIHVPESYTIDEVRDILSNTIKELDCNYTYDMLVFMKVMTPENYSNDKLYEKVDDACSNWAKHMLNARLNNGFPLREKIADVLWMFYLYTKKMKMFATLDAKEEMNKLQRYIGIHFEWQEKKCQILWPTRNKYVSFADQLNSLEENSTLEMTIETCTHLRMLSESKGNFNFDIDKTLYINNVVENNAIMSTLVTSFLGFYGKPAVLTLLQNSIITAKNPMTSLSDWKHSLYSVHYYFLWIVKTIMLRVWWESLNSLRKMKNCQSKKDVETLLYKRHLNDFACLFQLSKDDCFTKLIHTEADGALNKLIKYVLPSVSIEDKMFEITRLLKQYLTALPKLHNRNYNSETLEPVACQTSTLLNIANSIGYNIDNTRPPIRESILCAEVFVEYLKKILQGVNFNILQSFYVFNGMF